jgi:DHA2 family multidrug resistance protein-like MFS transporter
MINLALPLIANDLQVPVADALWLSRTNLLTCAFCILPCAALGDSFGHRRVLLAGLGMVTLTTLGSAMAIGLEQLIILRTLQGLGSAAIMCSTLVLIKTICLGQSLGKAMGLNAMFVAVTTTASPVLSGMLLELFNWRWLFVIPVPVAIVALALANRALPAPTQQRAVVDAPSILLVLTTLLFLLGATSGRTDANWFSLSALLTMGWFLYRQTLCRSPLLPLGVFANFRFSTALLASLMAFVGQSAVFVSIPLLLQRTLDYGPFGAACVFLAWPLMTALIAPFAGHYSDAGNPRRIAVVGLSLLTLGFAALATLPEVPQGWEVAWRMGLCGAGFGLFQSPNNREIMSNVHPQFAARGAALLCLARICGQAAGTIMVGFGLGRIGSLGGSTAAAERLVISHICWGLVALQLLSMTVTAQIRRRWAY